MLIDNYINIFRATGCGYAIDGKQGGRILSPLQQVDYRDFAANPRDWGTSWASSIGASEGWELDITCRFNTPDTSLLIFGAGYSNLMVQPSATFVLVNFYCVDTSASPVWSVEPGFASETTTNIGTISVGVYIKQSTFTPGEFHDLKLVRGDGFVSVYLDGSLVATCSGTLINNKAFSSITNWGNIQSITLKNAAGNVVWQAPQSELYTGWLLKPMAKVSNGATFEIRQGLIKLSSTVSTNTQGQFVASAAAGEITTPIDLRGYNGDFSIMWDGNDTLTRVTLLQGNGTTLQSPIVFSGDATRIFITVSNGTVTKGVAVNCPQGVHRVILVCDRTSNTLTLYVDDLSPSSTAIPDDFGALYNVSGYDNLRVRPSTYLSSFAFWPRALSAEEVAAL